ncbi:MAG: translation initiation factor IF-1 [Verrucomicrobia bacterium]|nr:translation initiation factor IF-1 [Verrucomicrobiota bacterium]
MSKDDSIRGEGVVVETLPNGTVRVEMPNGYRTLGYVPAKKRAAFGPLAPGDKVTVEMTPFDLSRGRMTGRR